VGAERLLRLSGVLFIAAFVAACGGSTPAATSTPAGQTPGVRARLRSAASTPTAAVTPAVTPPPVGGGSECAPFPTLNPASFAVPSFAPDPAIESKFPAQIDGSTPTEVQSGSWLQFICYYSGQSGVDQLKSQGGNSALISNLTFGSAKYTVGDNEVTVQAFRVAGADGNAIIQNISQFVAAAFGSSPEPFTTSQANIGGKNVTVVTNSDGTVSYAYVIGDTVISVSDVDQDQAATIFAAFP